MGQAGQVGLPNLQTVTVNSATQSGIQYTHVDETLSPAGTAIFLLFFFFIQSLNNLEVIPLLRDFLNPLIVCFHSGSGIRIKEEPDSEEWQLSRDTTLNTSDLSNLRVQMGDDDMETQSGEGKRLRRVACTCPNCKESGGRWAFGGEKNPCSQQDTQLFGLSVFNRRNDIIPIISVYGLSCSFSYTNFS